MLQERIELFGGCNETEQLGGVLRLNTWMDFTVSLPQWSGRSGNAFSGKGNLSQPMYFLDTSQYDLLPTVLYPNRVTAPKKATIEMRPACLPSIHQQS